MHPRRIDKRLWNRVFFIRMDKNKLPRRKSLNIYDIAKEAGVSISTVSRVLNKKSNVREDTKQRVEAVLEKHSYRPSAIARGLVSSSMRTVAVLTVDIRVPLISSTWWREKRSSVMNRWRC